MSTNDTDYFARVKEFWKRASKYPTNKEDHYPSHAVVQEFDLVEGGQNWLKGKRVLEYGCGGGSDTLSYLRRGAEVWFADVTPDNVTTTAIRAPDAHPLLLQGSASIPLADDSMDVVSSHGVIHHIVEPLPVLRELRRVLKPGGFLYIMLYTEHLWSFFEKTIQALVQKHGITREEAFGWCTDNEGCPHARSYTEVQGRALLSDAGFFPVWAKEYQETPGNHFRTYKARKP